MSQNLNSAVAVIGIDIGKNSFHIVGHDERGAITLRQKWSRGQIEARLANMPPCLIGMEALCRCASSQSRAEEARPRCSVDAGDRVRERLVSQRTGIINQIRAFLLERGVAVRQGQRFLRAELPRILATPPDVLLR
jgi:transposase